MNKVRFYYLQMVVVFTLCISPFEFSAQEEDTNNLQPIVVEIQEETLPTDQELSDKEKSESFNVITNGLSIAIIAILSLLTLSLYKNNNLRAKANILLKNKNTELQLAKEKAEKASLAKAQFLSTITHELRTPPPTPRPWYAPPAAPPTPRTPPSPSTCKEQSFRGEISPNFYHGAMLGQNNEVHQFFAEAAFPIGIDIDIDIQVMGIDRFDREADEELNFNFLGVDTDRYGPTPYEVPPRADNVHFIEAIQSMPRCAVQRLEIRNLQYPFAFLEVYRVGGPAAYRVTFSYPNGCDFASRFVYVHDGWVRDVTGETPEVCLNF